MTLREQISNDIKEAMKAKDAAKLSALRMAQAAFKNREIELRPNAMPEEEVLGVIKKLVKQRKESIEQFQAANRQDLVDVEQAELKLLESYMPAQLTREQIEKIVADVVKETGATSVKDMGKVMKEAQVRAGGQADNKIMSEVIKSKLT
ncbi:MAG: GatB/YqeY domain-containing protein [Proteobacteria bacterium]|nr:MAG: GatB/YqeY domain-containing protein [Pseudomonadota bacterium]